MYRVQKIRKQSLAGKSFHFHTVIGKFLPWVLKNMILNSMEENLSIDYLKKKCFLQNTSL